MKLSLPDGLKFYRFPIDYDGPTTGRAKEFAAETILQLIKNKNNVFLDTIKDRYGPKIIKIKVNIPNLFAMGFKIFP